MTEHVCIPYGWLSTVPVASGRISSVGGVSLGIFRLPADPLLFVTLTLDGVHADSEVRIYRLSDGSETAGVESCVENPSFLVPYYGTGQYSMVRVINSLYKIKEFAYTIPGVDQVIPVQQEPDKWYNNPA
ncbi:MAG: hypothetical protein KGZ88_11855 [Methylomicrobium sp.]|nr:hypothetical protein [Methylomicrobium sp.]